jgi:FAD:protein FMN transferase
MLRLDRIHFRALGTTCTLAATASVLDTAWARAALIAGRTEIEACECALSRFDPHSDLSRLNRLAGGWVEVDERLVEALAHAVRLREESRGRFDPTILPALAAAGYRRSYELLEPGLPAWEIDDWRAGGRIEVDRDGLRARIPEGVAVDLGAIGKGFAAVRALDAMTATWGALRGGLVDLGGDVAVRGEPPEGGPWLVAVEDPRSSGVRLGTIRLEAGGVATSGPSRRRFGPGNLLHHLIDPGTGEPAAGGPLAVTVTASDPAAADAHATALAVSGAEDAAAYVTRSRGLGAVVVDEAGEIAVLGDLDFILRRPAAEVIS